MATFWKISATSVNHVLFVSNVFAVSIISRFGFEDRSLVLIVPFPAHCLFFTLPSYIYNHLRNTFSMVLCFDNFISTNLTS